MILKVYDKSNIKRYIKAIASGDRNLTVTAAPFK